MFCAYVKIDKMHNYLTHRHCCNFRVALVWLIEYTKDYSTQQDLEEGLRSKSLNLATKYIGLPTCYLLLQDQYKTHFSFPKKQLHLFHISIVHNFPLFPYPQQKKACVANL